VLERAFERTYGLTMGDLFADPQRAIETYRYAVSEIIPALTEAAWRDKHDEILAALPDIQRSGFVFRYSRADHERDYGTTYQRPSRPARFLGFMYRLLPKIGPLKPLSFEAPTPEVELLFAQLSPSRRSISSRHNRHRRRPIRTHEHRLRHRTPFPPR
jgi:hypothetical protein